MSPPGRSSSVPHSQAAVEVELRARAARADGPGLPEVLRLTAAGRCGSRGTPIASQAAIASSSGPRPSESSPSWTVTQIDSGSNPRPLRLRSQANSTAPVLEVVADREVAEHLEERQVPGGGADHLDVRRAEALLAGGQAVVRRRLLAHEVRLERVHARRREQDATGRAAAGTSEPDGRRRWSCASKKRQERLADLVRPHGGPQPRLATVIGLLGRARSASPCRRRLHRDVRADRDRDDGRPRRRAEGGVDALAESRSFGRWSRRTGRPARHRRPSATRVPSGDLGGGRRAPAPGRMHRLHAAVLGRHGADEVGLAVGLAQQPLRQLSPALSMSVATMPGLVVALPRLQEVALEIRSRRRLAGAG